MSAERGYRPRRTVLALVPLLVGPAVVLAWFGWRSVDQEDRARRHDARQQAETEATRLVDEEAAALEAIRAREDRRPYFQYQAKYMPEDAVGLNGAVFVDSPLTRVPDDPRIVGWFQWTLSLGVVAGPDVFGPRSERVRGLLGPAAFGGPLRALLDTAPDDARVATAPVQSLTVQAVAANEEVGQLLEEVQVANETQKSTDYLDNFRARNRFVRAGESVERIDVRALPFRYLLPPPATASVDGAAGTSSASARLPVVAAWRLVSVPATAQGKRGAPRDRWLLQGYLLDGAQFFPVLQRNVLSGLGLATGLSAHARRADGDSVVVTASLLDRLDVGEARRFLPADRVSRMRAWPALHVVASPDVDMLDAERRTSAVRYLAIVGGLVFVVATGLFVLVRSVRRDVALAERKQDFVAAVTHELKTPLASIRMYADMLKEGWVPEGETPEDYADRIVVETKRLTALVDQVLDLAALDRGVATVHATPGDVGATVRDAVALVAPAAQRAGVPVHVDVETGLAPLAFDANFVRAMVVNLVDNAVKYSAASPTKDVRVTVRRTGGAVEVAVADRGPGIAVADQARLFEPFHRAGREDTRTAAGVGLGLALVRRYADAHRAKVALSSAVGTGTTVTVRFPA